MAQIAKTIGRAIGLNEDLIEAIALGMILDMLPLLIMEKKYLIACYLMDLNIMKIV